MRIHTIALLAVALTALLSASAYAQPDGGPPAFGRHAAGPAFGMLEPGKMIGRMAEHLDLDDTQRETVRNIMSAAKPEFEALREQFHANREALEALEASDAAYDAEVQNIAMSNGELATEGTLLFTRVRSEIDAVLTDEQREKLAAAKERRGERREERFERRKNRQ